MDGRRDWLSRRDITNLVTILGWLFIVSGTVLALVAIRSLSHRRAFIRGSSVATGVVIALRAEPDGADIQPLAYPRIRFQAASGREVTFESRVARSGSTWAVGEAVPVRYLIAHPEMAELDSPVALWGAAALFAILALVFLAVGVGLRIGLISG